MRPGSPSSGRPDVPTETRRPVLAESTSGSPSGSTTGSASDPAPGPGTVGAGSLVAGRFRLDDLLEDQAGARLWRATDLTLARSVAVHVLPSADPRAGAVLTAARTSATVSDSRVLRVLDALDEGDHVSIVHEWGSGLSLDRLVADAPLPARRAAWLVREVAEAIAVAHRHGVAHGRLLPENVMVNDAGTVKLAGFVVDGVLLGRSRPSAGEEGQRPAVPPLSEHESDVRNLGGLLYAALTGRWPGSPESVLPPAPPAERGLVCRPRQVRSGVPRALDALCDRVLNASENGTRSIETAGEIWEALSAFLGDPVPGTAVPATLLEAPGTDLDAWDHIEVAPDATVAIPSAAGPAHAVDPDRTQAWQAPPGHSAARPAATARTNEPDPDLERARRRTPTPLVTAPQRSDVPVHWGPDRPDDRPPGAVPAPRGGVPWLRVGAVLAVLTLTVLGVVVAFDLGSTPSGPPDDPPSAGAPSATATPSRPVDVTVTSFDPDDQSDGPPEENSDLVPLVTDGDPATSWETETYVGGPPLAPYKRGVGLLLDLGRETDVATVDVTLTGVHDFTLFAAPAGSTAPPTDVAGLSRVAREEGVQGRVRWGPAAGATGVSTRYLVVWLTALPVSGTGFRGQVAEVVVRS